MHIAAGGKGSRLDSVTRQLNDGAPYPKLLLPTQESGDETLLGRVVRTAQAAKFSGRITLHTSEFTEPFIAEHSDIEANIRMVRTLGDNSLRAFIDPLLDTGSRILGASGDHYANYDWDDIVATHEAQGFAVTFMVGRTVAVDDGAVFDINSEGRITSFERKDRTDPNDYVNIGAYVFDFTQVTRPLLSNLMRPLDSASQEEIVEALIHEKAAGAYILPDMPTPFNVNTPETYSALLAHTSSAQSAA